MTDIDPIKHVVLLMLENHSFDQMLGSLQSICADLDGVDIEAEDARFNLDESGAKVYQIPTDEPQVLRDPKHETKNVLRQLSDSNGGFVLDYQRSVRGTTSEDRQDIMGYYALDRLTALHTLKSNAMTQPPRCNSCVRRLARRAGGIDNW